MSFKALAFESKSAEAEMNRLWQYVGRKPRAQLFSTRRFGSAVPGPIRIAQGMTATANGYQFSFYYMGGTVTGYRIYRSTINNASVAQMVDVVPQPATVSRMQTALWQETTAASPFYWVAAVNKAGKEGIRTPVTASAGVAVGAAPIPQPNDAGTTDPGERGGGGRGCRKYEMTL